MKKKKLNKEKITRVLVYVLCFALVGISLFSLFSVFVGATDSESDADISVVAECDHYYEYVRSLPELQGTHADVYTCAYCSDTYYEYAIPCEYAVFSVNGVISGYCLSCSQECVHQWQDGYCPVCTFPCPHENHTIDGACSDCDMTSGAHNFNNVVCEPNGSDRYHTTKKYCDCGYVETDFEVEHTYVNGKCSACEYQCTHSVYMDSVCICCGFTCPHFITTKYIKSANSEKHIEMWVCADCGAWTSETLFYHSFDSNAICTKCGYGCSHTDTSLLYHYNGDKGTHLMIENCATCGLSFDVTTQEHSLVDGVCSKCNYACRHTLDEHCVYTTNPVKHPWETYCVDCGVVTKTIYVEHKFNSSYKCSCCGYVCTHSKTEFKYTAVNDGNEIWYHSRVEFCSYCSYVVDTVRQEHSWAIDGGGFCTFCGLVCYHAEYSEGVCVDCGALCPHDDTYIIYSSVESSETPDYLHWVRVYCADCDVRVRTDPRDGGQEKCTYVNGACAVCEHKCSHKRGYNNDTCIRCKMVCDHSVGFENVGECKQCNYICPHPKTYWHYTVTDKGADDDYHVLLKDCTFCKCQISSQSQAHTYNADFKCTACDRYCKHSTFENIICKHCGFNCPHGSYTSGVCDLCGIVCSHRWEKSTCKICALVCENHTFTNGSLRCDICDYYVIYDGYQQNDGFFKLMTAIFDAQTNTYFSLLGYEILGVNIAYFVLSLVTLALAIIVFKIVKKVM